MLQYSALVVGIAKNCATALPVTLRRLEGLSNYFQSIRYVAVTNDSHDQTASILQDWSAQRTSVLVVSLDGLADALPHRTARVSFARNVYIRELQRRTQRLSAPDLLLVADLDGVNSNLVSGSEFERAITAAPAGW